MVCTLCEDSFVGMVWYHTYHIALHSAMVCRSTYLVGTYLLPAPSTPQNTELKITEINLKLKPSLAREEELADATSADGTNTVFQKYGAK